MLQEFTMPRFCQRIRMLFNAWNRWKGAPSNRATFLTRPAWQALILGMVLTNSNGPVGIPQPGAESFSALSCRSGAGLGQPDERPVLDLARGFPPSSSFFGERTVVWLASRPEDSLPPPRAIDRKWEGTLAPAEAALLADAADAHLDHHSLFQAALIAGGTVQDDLLRHYEAKFQAWIAQLREQNVSTQTPLQRAETIFRFMHQRILTGGYELRASDLAGTIQTGQYNCVSASLLYNCLVEQFGIEARGLEWNGHARTRLLLPNTVLDVETTCARWFDLLRNPEESLAQVTPVQPKTPQWRAKTAEKHAPTGPLPPERANTQQEGYDFPRRQSPGREVANLALVATIYYNRGVDLLTEGRYSEALAANAKALRLDPEHPTAWGNFLATMNNWAVALGRSGRYSEAAALLAHGLALAPSYGPFQTNFVHVHSQWTDQLCREGRFAEALDILARSAPLAPASYVGAFREAQLRVAKEWSQACLSRGDTLQAVHIWKELQTRLGMSQDVLEAEAAGLHGLVQTEGSTTPSDGTLSEGTTSTSTKNELP